MLKLENFKDLLKSIKNACFCFTINDETRWYHVWLSFTVAFYISTSIITLITGSNCWKLLCFLSLVYLLFLCPKSLPMFKTNTYVFYQNIKYKVLSSHYVIKKKSWLYRIKNEEGTYRSVYQKYLQHENFQTKKTN